MNNSYTQAAAIFACLIIMSLPSNNGYTQTTQTNNVNSKRLQIVKQYHRLKAKTNSGKRVRVIAKAAMPPPGIRKKSHFKSLIALKNNKTLIQPQKEIPQQDLAVYNVNSQELDRLADSGLVEAIFEDTIYVPALNKSSKHIKAHKLHNNPQLRSTGNNFGVRGQGQTIAIVDTGVDESHWLLKGKVVKEACFSTNDPSKKTRSACPNGQEKQIGDNAGENCSDDIAGCGHGTHVAGIAASHLLGIAPDADIAAVQITSLSENFDYCYYLRGQLPPCIIIFSSDVIAALNWLYNEANISNLAAINLSIKSIDQLLSYEPPSKDYCDKQEKPMKSIIDKHRKKGTLTVIAAGNQGYTDTILPPGCISSAITVGSTWRDEDRISDFSSSASMVDLVAPGGSKQNKIMSLAPNHRIVGMAGTSMAAPHVAGAIALLRSYNNHASVEAVEDALKEGPEIIDPRNGLSFNRLDLWKSLAHYAWHSSWQFTAHP